MAGIAQDRFSITRCAGAANTASTATINAQIDRVHIFSSVFVPHTEAEYQRLVTLLDGLIDEVGENESHPLASLMEIVGVLIETYEDERVLELPTE